MNFPFQVKLAELIHSGRRSSVCWDRSKAQQTTHAPLLPERRWPNAAKGRATIGTAILSADLTLLQFPISSSQVVQSCERSAFQSLRIGTPMESNGSDFLERPVGLQGGHKSLSVFRWTGKGDRTGKTKGRALPLEHSLKDSWSGGFWSTWWLMSLL